MNDPYLSLLEQLKRRDPPAVKKHFLKGKFMAAVLDFPYGELKQSFADIYAEIKEELNNEINKKNPKRLFKDGKIPREIREDGRLVDEETPEGLIFQDKMQNIIKRLIGDDYDEKEHKFRFFISDKDEVNCSIVTFSNPPIIMATKKLIEKCKTEDELAAVLAHELGHWEMFRQIGLHGNSNPEEAGSDLWSVRLLQKSGYKTSAILDVMEMLKGEHDGSFQQRSLLDILDPHPPINIRIRNIENAIAVVEHSQKLNTSETNLDEALRECCKTATYESYMDGLKKKYNFDRSAPIEDRVKILELMMFDHFIADRKAASNKGQRDFLRLIENTIAEAKRENKKDLFHPIYYRLIALPRTVPKKVRGEIESYEHVMRNEAGDDFYSSYGVTAKGYGQVREVWKSARKFVRAKTPQEALKHAKIINEFFNTYDPASSLILNHRYWPSFIGNSFERAVFGSNFERDDINDKIDEAVAKGEPFELPWNKHRKWGINPSIEGHQEIMQALHRYNLDDPRLPERPENLATFAIDACMTSLSRDYDIDDDGHLMRGKFASRNDRFYGYGNKEVSFLKRSEINILAKEEAKAKLALKSVNWDELEEDFEAFVAKHHHFLAPQLTLPDLQSQPPVFIEEFVNRTLQLYKANPLIWQPKLKAFFHVPPKEEGRLSKIFNKMSGKNKDKTPKTFMQLVDYFQDETTYRNSDFDIWRGPLTPKGLPLHHPYMRLLQQSAPLLKNKRGSFDILQHFDIYMPKLPTLKDRPDPIFSVDLRAIINYSKPKTGKALIKTVNDLSDLFTRRDQISASLNEYKFERNNTPAKILADLIKQEIHTFILDHPDQDIDFHTLNSARKVVGFSPAFSPYLYSKYTLKKDEDKKKGTNSLIVKQWERREKQFDDALTAKMAGQLEKEIANKKTNVKKLIQLYAVYSQTSYGSIHLSLFKRRPDLRDKFETNLMNRLAKIKSVTRRKNRLEELLFSHSIDSPQLRENLVQQWVTAQTHIIKEEIGWKWQRDLKRIADRVVKGAKKGQALPMLSGLIDELEPQEKESFMVRDKLVTGLLGSGQGVNGLLASMGDNVMAGLGNNKKLGQSMLQFFTAPLSDELSLHTFNELYKDSKDKAYDKSSQLGAALENAERMPDITKIDLMANLHKNFWSLPFPARTIYLERILFPVDETSPKEFEKAVKFVLDAILPEGQPYADEARLILSTHMEGCSKPMQRLILSAMMTASEKQEGALGEAEIRPGQVLSLVLTRSGAAGGKILQAIHSYLQSIDSEDPDLIQFRDDLKSAKSDFNRPFRWDIFERLKEAMPKKMVAAITIGKLLGAGSYGYTVEKKSRWWQATTALTLLRKDVAYQAQHQFSHFRQTAEKLSAIDPKWTPLVGILQNAEEMSEIEADFNIAGEQIRYAVGLYNSYKIKADDKSFKIKTAPLYDCSDEYKDVGLANGVHFNDLPEKTAKEKSYKQAAAKALFTAEIAVMLSGKAFDYDRHGAQQRLEGRTITLFDHGSLMYDLEGKKVKEPSELEKKVLGTIIANVYESTQQGGGDTVMNVLMEQLSNTERYGDAAQFVESFKRGILALGDFRRSMGQTDEQRNKAVESAIKAVMFSGGVDSTIINTILEKIDPQGTLRAQNQNLPQQDADISIKQHGGATYQNRQNAVRSFMLSYMKEKWANVTSKKKRAPTP